MSTRNRWWALLLGLTVALTAATAVTVVALPEAHAQAPDKEFTISVGETLTFNARGVSRLTVGLATVVDAKTTNDQRQVILTGLSPGVTTVNIYSDRGQKTLLIRVVGVNPQSLAEEVREVLGDRSGVEVRVVKGRVLLEGEVASEIFKRKIEKLTELYANQVLNFTTFREAFVEGARMVALDVYFVQMATADRDRLGLHWGHFLGANATFGANDVPLYYQEGFGEGILPGESNPLRLPYVTAVTGGDGASYWSLVGNLNVALDLLTTHGLIRTVKTGTIITETGTEAIYHTGGTINVVLTGFGANSEIGKIPYGIELWVTPVLDFENRVKLKMRANITDLDYSNAVGDVPATRDNQVEAVVNMVEGQSALVMASHTMEDSSNETGWWLLSRIPILGWIFKGRNRFMQATDSAFFVTPRVYEPGGPGHRTLVQGVFERLIDAGAEAEDLPELSNAQQAPRPAPSAPMPVLEDPDDEGADLLDE